MSDIDKLKEKWNKNKEDYKSKEVGSGVHSFVKDVFLSNEIFNLKETVRNTKKELTFVHDTEADKNGRPDFILYIDENITIVCEVKCYGNIKSGEEQILRYQSGYNKQYGILTDGYEWRFYNGNFYRVITINDILEDNKKFITLWNEFKSQEYYYLELFDDKNNVSFKVEEEKELFFNSITSLIYNFKTKLNLAGYFINDADKDKKATEISYAYIIQFILYKTLIDNSYIDFNNDFKDRLDVISKNLKSGDASYMNILNNIKSISSMISAKLYRPFKKEQEFINEKLESIMSKPKAMLSDISLWLDIILFIRRFDFSNVRNDIFGFVYENYLKELYEDKDKGQYFTDPDLVDFMLDEMGYTRNNISKLDEDKISIIDPSCGAGTFLYNAVSRIIDAFFDGSESNTKYIEKLINENIFGLDISEFPLYLAEMSILMRMLPIIINEKYNNPLEKKIQLFKTNDSISEFINTDIMDNSNIEKENGQYFINYEEDLSLGYNSYIRDEEDLKDLKVSISPPRRRFDYVIGNPPYIGYNECCIQNILFTKLIKEKRMYMSNIYGVNLNTVPNRIKPYSPKPNLYAFFIALGIGLLKENGKLAYIIPQTLLIANDLDVVRYHIAKFTTIEKIISFDAKMFIGRGIKQEKPISTSSLIIILINKKPNKNKIKIVNYQGNHTNNIKKYLNSRNKTVNTIEQNILLERLDNWNFIRKNIEDNNFINAYVNNSINISTFRKTLLENEDLVFDGGVKIEENKITKKFSGYTYEIFDYKNNDYKNFNLSSSDIFYPKNEYIKFLPGSQGIRAFSKKYKIIWRTKFNGIFQFTDRDILLISNQSLIVSSDSEKNILLLFSILNNKISKKILEINLKLENETNYLVPIKSIKQYIRIPIITKSNEFIKNEIINKTKKLLNLENIFMKDIIDFSDISMQKFSDIYLYKNYLILKYNNKDIKLHIKNNKLNIVKQSIENNLKNTKNISLNKIKMLKVIDYKKREELKNYIDHLIFLLYFNIDTKSDIINNIDNLKKLCSKNKFYGYIFGE